MAKKRELHALWPLAGLNRKGAYRQQRPYSSPDMNNVRSTGALEGRERGGSRPGLVYSHITDIGSSVRLLHPMTLAPGDGFTSFSDNFSGLSLAAAWAQASWASDVPVILQPSLASVTSDVSEGEVVLSALTIDTAQTYEVEMMLSPWKGEWHGAYRLYLRLDNTTPAFATDGVQIELIQTGSTGAYTASLKSYTGAAETVVDTADSTLSAVWPGWLSAIVSGMTVTVYWNGTQILTGIVDAHSGSRVGFGLNCTVDGGICLANTFRVQYYSTGSVNALRSVLIASAGGNLWEEGPYGTMTQVSSALSVRSDVALSAAQIGQKLYVADYGDLRDTGTDGTMSSAKLDDGEGQDWTTLGIDAIKESLVCVLSNVAGGTAAGTYAITAVHATDGITLSPDPGDGTCSYRIERAPKIFDPLAGTIVIQTATTGQVPTGCPLTCRSNDRQYLAGAEIAPHVWFASRSGDPLDYDYSQSDSKRAVAGTASDSGVPGDPLTAMFAFSDDYVIFACLDSLWRLAGDPAYGGKLDNLSHAVGIVDENAWTIGPGGELIFLSLDGLYAVQPGGNSYPIPLSSEVLPWEFKNIDTNQLEVSLEFDTVDRGLDIFLTPVSSNTRIHWWFDWDTKTFWPLTLQSDHEPTATCSYRASAVEGAGVLLGGRDGKLRMFSSLAGNDCGTAFSSYIMIGPIPLAQDAHVGRIIAMNATMASESGDVTWSLHPALTFQAAVSAAAIDSGTWSAGLNDRDDPTCRGQAAVLKITGTSHKRWAFENTVMTVMAAGRRLND